MKTLAAGCLILLLSGCVATQHIKESTSPSLDERFDLIRNDTPALINFLDKFPKGGDLHNHASGAAYIEFGVIEAARRGYLYDLIRYEIIKDGAVNEYSGESKSRPKSICKWWMKEYSCLITVKDLLGNNLEFQKFLDVVSVRGWYKNTTNGQDHFFNAFNHASVPDTTIQYLAEIIARNHSQGVRYVEIMTSSVDKNIVSILSQILPESEFDSTDMSKNYTPAFESYLQSKAFESAIKRDMDERALEVDAVLRKDYGITILGEHPDIVVRYIPQLHRLKSLYNIYINTAANLKASKIDNRIVATNMVQNEAGIESLINFKSQMEILDFFWNKLGQPNIALHAGELVLQESPLEPMRNRISQSIEVGHASRIGHGVSIAWEADTEGTLAMMKRRGIAVEICLSSNEVILGISGNDHPIAMYKAAGVPITLATDDEGISRSNLSMEYVKAAQEHNLSYSFLKEIARNALKYSFVEGDGIYGSDGLVLSKYRNTLSVMPSITEVGARAYLQIRFEQDMQNFEDKMTSLSGSVATLTK